MAQPVHPRRRGEHNLRWITDAIPAGSSPQARGTRSGKAWRGAARQGGSSPQARGTQIYELLGPEQARFIPAGAGNTRARSARPPPSPVHPRRRGEHQMRPERGERVNGSSPQARGTLSEPGIIGHDDRFIPAGAVPLDRFIPAGAGNTCRSAGRPARIPVHPRRRGEHNREHGLTTISDGSSPQARGTLTIVPIKVPRDRFIPAGAGNTPEDPGCSRATPVHPRRRGEHSSITHSPQSWCGSSPQARGTHHVPGDEDQDFRFIPAGAGNTS